MEKGLGSHTKTKQRYQALRGPEGETARNKKVSERIRSREGWENLKGLVTFNME